MFFVFCHKKLYNFFKKLKQRKKKRLHSFSIPCQFGVGECFPLSPTKKKKKTFFLPIYPVKQTLEIQYLSPFQFHPISPKINKGYKSNQSFYVSFMNSKMEIWD